MNDVKKEIVESTSRKKGGKLLFISLIIIISVCCLGTGGYLLIFNENKTNDTSDLNMDNVVNKDDKNSESDNNDNDSTKVVGFKYALIELDRSTYDFKTMKNSSTSDTLSSYDINDSRKITYTYEIKDGNVIIANVTDDNNYTVKNIKNAKELIATDMGQSSESAGLFVITTDEKLYSISLYNTNGVFKLIRDCSQFEDTIQTYDISATNISQGSYYAPAFPASGEGAILVTDSNNKQYILKNHN